MRSGRYQWWVRLVVLVTLAAGVTHGESGATADGVSDPITPRARNHPLQEIWSGKRFSSDTARALHDAVGQNPAGGILADGALMWRRPAGETDKSCQSCHNDPSFSMRSAGTRYPRYYKPWKKVMSLEQRINRCRTEHMRAKPFGSTSRSLVSMTTFVRHQSRRTPVRPQSSGRAAPFFQRGERLFYERIGQQNMSCANCHQKYQGKRLGAQTVSQGQSNGFPTYNLGTGAVSSLHQQFQRCNARAGAEPLDIGSDEYVNLELYLAWRGQGLPVETPAVRD